jgi:translation initiation factor 1
MRSKSGGGLVYSTEKSICPKCGKPLEACPCRKALAPPPAGDGTVRVGRQTQGRKGKGVTVITGLPFAGEALEKIASDLKRKCGSGGTVKDGIVEIQGDHRDLLVEELGKLGYRVKRSGG